MVVDHLIFNVYRVIDRVKDRCGVPALSGKWTRIVEHNGDVQFQIEGADGLLYLIDFSYDELNGDDVDQLIVDRFAELEDKVVSYYV